MSNDTHDIKDYSLWLKEVLPSDGQSDRIMEYLLDTQFFDSPASTNAHSVFDGGLVQHTLLVAEVATTLQRTKGLVLPDTLKHEQVIQVALLHEIGNAMAFNKTVKNVPSTVRYADGSANTTWTTVDAYEYKNPFPTGSGTASIWILTNELDIKIPWPVASAIRWIHDPSWKSRDARAQNSLVGYMQSVHMLCETTLETYGTG